MSEMKRCACCPNTLTSEKELKSGICGHCTSYIAEKERIEEKQRSQIYDKIMKSDLGSKTVH